VADVGPLRGIDRRCTPGEAFAKLVPGGDPVAITYPYDTVYTMQPMLWQAEDGFDFRLLGGYAYHPDSVGSPYLLPLPMTPSGLAAVPRRCGESQRFRAPTCRHPRTGGQHPCHTVRLCVRLVNRGPFGARKWSGHGAVHRCSRPPQALLRPVLPVANWQGVTTTTLLPAKGATLAGTRLLDATTAGDSRVTSVEFLLTDRARHTTGSRRPF